MIGRIVIALLVVLIGACVGILMVKDAGYVLIEYANVTVETSIWVAVAILALVFVLIRIGRSLYRTLASPNGSLGSWWKDRGKRKSTGQVLAALQLEVAGDLKAARARLLEASKHVDDPTLVYAYAAELASRQGDIEESEAILAKLTTGHDELHEWERLQLAIGKSGRGNLREAASILQEIRAKHTKSDTIALALLRVASKSNEWSLVQELATQLESSNLIDQEELGDLLHRSWREKFAQSPETASEMWKAASKTIRENPSMIQAYVRALQDQGELKEAHSVLTKELTRRWDGRLVREFGSLNHDPTDLLKQGEKWLGSHSNDADLLFCLGRLSKRAEQHTKAREYLETSLRLREDRDTYLELAQLCLRTGEVERAGRYLELAY